MYRNKIGLNTIFTFLFSQIIQVGVQKRTAYLRELPGVGPVSPAWLSVPHVAIFTFRNLRLRVFVVWCIRCLLRCVLLAFRKRLQDICNIMTCWKAYFAHGTRRNLWEGDISLTTFSAHSYCRSSIYQTSHTKS